LSLCFLSLSLELFGHLDKTHLLKLAIKQRTAIRMIAERIHLVSIERLLDVGIERVIADLFCEAFVQCLQCGD
jgi:hypothetical protein